MRKSICFKKTLKGALLALGLVMGVHKVQAQQNLLVQELDRALHPLDTAGYSAEDFLPKAVFSDAVVIALGESTHGTKEFYRIKDQVIRNQVLYNNVKIVAMETDFCTLMGLNTYLQDNSRPLDSLPMEFYRSGMYGVYYTKEVADMLFWIKSYNLSKPESKDKVKLFGLDMKNPHSITRSLMDRFPQLHAYSPADYNQLEELNTLFSAGREVRLPDAAMDAYTRLCDRMALLARSKAPVADTLYLLRMTELLKQSLMLQNGNEPILYREKRDAFMAANAIWLQQNFGTASSKMVVWAHNGHIAHAKLGGTHRMGYHLKAYFKEGYYAVDLLFDEGSVRIYDAKGIKRYKPYFYSSSTNKKSVEYHLKESAVPLFFLEVRGMLRPALTALFKQHTYQRVIGARYGGDSNKVYDELPVMDCFDAVIFIKNTRAAEDVGKVGM